MAPSTLVDGPLLPRLALASLALALPSALFLPARLMFTSNRLLRSLYGLLPLIWALLLARHLPVGMAEAGMLLPVSFGLSELPGWRADPHVIGFCQSAVVVMGWVWAVVLLRRQLVSRLQVWIWASGLALALAAGGRLLVAA